MSQVWHVCTVAGSERDPPWHGDVLSSDGEEDPEPGVGGGGGGIGDVLPGIWDHTHLSIIIQIPGEVADCVGWWFSGGCRESDKVTT